MLAHPCGQRAGTTGAGGELRAPRLGAAGDGLARQGCPEWGRERACEGLTLASEKWEVLIPGSFELAGTTPYSSWTPISKPVPARFPASERLKALSLGALLIVPFLLPLRGVSHSGGKAERSPDLGQVMQPF